MTVSSIEDGVRMYTGGLTESKSGTLMICSSSSPRILQQFSKQRSPSKSERGRLPTDELRTELKLQKRIASMQSKPYKDGSHSPTRFSGNSTSISKTVKISVYTNVTNPYLVVHDSTLKFSVPIGYLKLRKCRIIPSSTIEETNEGNEQEDKQFRIYPNISDDVLVLQASNKETRDEWVRFLSPFTQNEFFNPQTCRQNKTSTSLSILEERDEEGAQEIESYKAPSRRQRTREGRRGSASSMALRLQRRTLITCPKA